MFVLKPLNVLKKKMLEISEFWKARQANQNFKVISATYWVQHHSRLHEMWLRKPSQTEPNQTNPTKKLQE